MLEPISTSRELKLVESALETKEDTDPGLSPLQRLALSMKRVKRSAEGLVWVRTKQKRQRERTLRVLQEGQRLLKSE